MSKKNQNKLKILKLSKNAVEGDWNSENSENVLKMGFLNGILVEFAEKTFEILKNPKDSKYALEGD